MRTPAVFAASRIDVPSGTATGRPSIVSVIVLITGAVVVAVAGAVIYAAVARKDLKGFSAPNWHAEEALSREEALQLFTAAPAFARFAEDELGTLEVGKRADLTAFSVDLMTAPEAEIPKGHAVLTVVDGQVVYRRD